MITRRGLKIAGVLLVFLVLIASFGAMAKEKSKATSPKVFEPKMAGKGGPEAFKPGEFLVRFKDGVKAPVALSVFERAGAKVLKKIYFKPSKAFPEGLTIYHVGVAQGKAMAGDVARALRADPAVKYVVPNRKVYAYTGPVTPDDPLFVNMWGLNNTGQEFFPGVSGTPDADIDAPEGWAVRHDAANIIVADIDTGIQVDHPDLAANIWVNEDEIPGNGIDDDENGYIDDVNGWDFYWDDNTLYDPADEEDHGTHTAGTVGAVGDNEFGVTGVAWSVKIMALKFLGPDGGSTDDAVEAFAYAWNNGANLTTNSWGYTGPPDEALQDAMAACQLLHICAAGNDAADNDAGYPDNTHYPSSFPLDNIVSVAASEWHDEMAYFSCYGATTVDLAAPGHGILSTVPTDRNDPPYAYFSGTSMATPHVAGAAALLMAHNPGMAPFPGALGAENGELTIKDLLLNYADPKLAFAGKMVSGGRLNLRNSLLQVVPPAIDSIAADPTFGAPPLAVSFQAAAHDKDGTIADKWWDFGDGSEPVHEFNASHTYQAKGTFTATFHAVDDDGLENTANVKITVVGPGTAIFVDDDGGASYESYFTAAMDAAGIPYVVMTPPLAIPVNVPNPIIWNCGDTWEGTLTAQDQAFLAAYLDNGGKLYLCGQDVIWDLGINDFVQNYLHVTTADEDVGAAYVDGVSGDPITDGMHIELSYPFDDYSDAITPGGGASGIFTNPDGDFAALRYVGNHVAVFQAFPFEAIPGPSSVPTGKVRPRDLGDAADVIWKVYHWMVGTNPPVIDSFGVDPLFGSPPLQVTCSATAHDSDGGA